MHIWAKGTHRHANIRTSRLLDRIGPVGRFDEKNLNGGGPAGSTLGLLEYLSHSNNNADSVNPDDTFKFLDDLTVLEIVNLLTISISS